MGSPQGKQPSRIFLSNHDQDNPRNHDFIFPQSIIPFFFCFLHKCTMKRETQNHLVNIHPMTKKYANGKRRSLGPSFFSSFFSSWPQTETNNQSINRPSSPFFSPFDKISLTPTEPYPYPHTKNHHPDLHYLHFPAGSHPPHCSCDGTCSDRDDSVTLDGAEWNFFGFFFFHISVVRVGFCVRVGCGG